MCGRYRLRRYDLLQAAFDAMREMDLQEFSELDVRWWNIAPSLELPVVRLNNAGQRVIADARWGFIPSWAKELPKVRPINAKAETVSTNGVFRRAFQSRRCLIPADGFYEWQKPAKQPYFIHRKDDGLFAFAGLWEQWQPHNDAAPIDTFTILTTRPNELMAPIHNRMPVIVSRKDYTRWLDSSLTGDTIADILNPYPAEEMDAYAVTSAVNNTRNDGPDLIKAINDNTSYDSLFPPPNSTGGR